jgi:hypothetical protein
VRGLLGGVVVAVVCIGIVFIDVIPTWALAATAGFLGGVSVIAWLLIERRMTRDVERGRS